MTKRRKPHAPEPNTCLTTSELAAWFRIHPSTVERWNIPSVAPGRYLFSDVLEWCAAAKAKRQAA